MQREDRRAKRQLCAPGSLQGEKSRGSALRALWSAVSIAGTDMWSTRVAWAALVVTSFVACGFLGVAYAFLLGESTVEGIESLSGTVIGFAVLGVLTAVGTLSGLVVGERRSTLAKWKLAGMPDTLCSLLMLAQVLSAVFLGAVAGLLVAPILLRPTKKVLDEALLAIDPSYGIPAVAWALGTVLAATLGSALPQLWRVYRLHPLRALREATLPRAKPGFWSTACGLGALGGYIALFETARRGNFDAGDELASSVFGMHMLLVCAVVFLMDWLIVAAVAVGGVPAKWRLPGPVLVALANLRRYSLFSRAVIIPWVVTGVFVVSTWAVILVGARWMEGTSTSEPELMLLLIAPALVPNIVAGLVSTLVILPRVRGDDRALLLAGAPPGFVWRAAVAEAGGICVFVISLVAAVTLSGIVVTTGFLTGDPFTPGWLEAFPWKLSLQFVAALSVLVASTRLIGRGRTELTYS